MFLETRCDGETSVLSRSALPRNQRCTNESFRTHHLSARALQRLKFVHSVGKQMKSQLQLTDLGKLFESPVNLKVAVRRHLSGEKNHLE